MTDRALDKFYTHSTLVDQCLGFIHKELSQHSHVLEPSAGDGAFSSHIKSRVTACDIQPEHPSILKMDFLHSPLIIDDADPPTLVVGNPPFGRQCSLAIRFFNRCASYPSITCIAMVLPKSFRKPSIQNRLNLFFRLDREMDIGMNSAFILSGEPYDVPCVFQVWKRADRPRVKIPTPLLAHPGILSFTKTLSEDDRTVAVRRVGYNAGRASLYTGNQNPQTHYFLVITKIVRSGSLRPSSRFSTGSFGPTKTQRGHGR